MSSIIDSAPPSWKQYSPLIMAASLVAGGVAAKYLIDERKRRRPITHDDLFEEDNLEDLFHAPEGEIDSTEPPSLGTLADDPEPNSIHDAFPVPMIEEEQLDRLCESLINEQLAGTDSVPQEGQEGSANSVSAPCESVREAPTRVMKIPPATNPAEHESASPPEARKRTRDRRASRWSLVSWFVLFCFLALAGLSASYFRGWSSLEQPPPVATTLASAPVDAPLDYETVKIENIQTGDLVYAYNPETGQVEQQRVLQTFKRTAFHLRLLDFVDESGQQQRIETTDEHPFWVVEREDFVEARDLQIGDSVQGPDGELQRLAASVREVHPEGIAVYNFEVESLHDYYVLGKETRGSPVLVHNAGYSNAALGRTGKQARLRELGNDPDVSRADRGWIKQELNQIKRGKRKNIRLPGSSRARSVAGRKYGGNSGSVLAHRRGFEARKGFGYKHSDIQEVDLHKLQHKHEGYK